ncbi:MAG: hypothetical protein ACTHLW_21050 [Verrucomicrobiota bacterium]
MEQFKTVLGTNHGKPKSRIWIEGKRLVEAGFTVGTRYNRELFENAIRLGIHPEGKFKVSGKGYKPIIDITGSAVTDRFTGTHVNVRFEPSCITIAF